MAAAPRHILVVPMDWGLGHATRCVPVIRRLLERGHRVSLGTSGAAGEWLKNEFPSLPFFPFPSYNIAYSGRLPMAVQMLRKAPSILRTIDEEHSRLEEILRTHTIDAVISDNRYGVRHERVLSVLITHQVQVHGGAMRFMEPLLLRAALGYIRRFDACWVPDWPGEDNLGGTLSHTAALPYHLRYTGPLSRFTDIPQLDAVPLYDLAVVLSGPEPHRSGWEQRLLHQLSGSGLRVAFIRGTQAPLAGGPPAGIDFTDTADTYTLQTIVQRSALVLSRSGYSSVMDWTALQKKAILVPTPGQTEQEYLATYLRSRGYFYTIDREDEMELTAAMRFAMGYVPPPMAGDALLQQAIDGLFPAA